MQKNILTLLAVALCFVFMCVGFLSMFINAETHYIKHEKIYYLNGAKVLTQKFAPRRAKVVFSWKDNNLTKKDEE